MYGCDRMVSCDPTQEKDEIARAYREMKTAVESIGKPVEKMTVEIVRCDGFSMIGWRVYEKATTA